MPTLSPRPAAVVPDRALSVEPDRSGLRKGVAVTLAACLLASVLSGCGGQHGDDPFARAKAGERQSALSAPTSRVLDADPDDVANQVFSYAQSNFPQYFPSQASTSYSAPYLYRHYPSTGVYLGVADGTVYVMGGAFGGVPLRVGVPTDFIMPVNSRATFNSVSGRLMYAAKSNVTVFWDCNGNWQLDAYESRVVSDDEGRYTLSPAPSAACQLRARTSPDSSDAGSARSNRRYTMSALPGRTTQISPLTTLAALSGQTSGALESALSLPVGAVELAEYLAPQHRLAATRAAIAVADQLQQRDRQLAGGDIEPAGRAIVAYTRQLIDAGVTVQGAQRRYAAANVGAARRLSGLTGIGFYPTAGLPMPAGATELSRAFVQSTDSGARWRIRSTTGLTDAQVAGLTEFVAVLNDKPVPAALSGYIDWTLFDDDSLKAKAARARSLGLVPATDFELKARGDAWTQGSKSIDATEAQMRADADIEAFFYPREGSMAFVTTTAVNMAKAVLAAAQFGGGIRVDEASLLDELPMDLERWQQAYQLMKQLKPWLAGTEWADCVNGLATFYDKADSGAQNVAAAGVATLGCLTRFSDSKLLNIVATGVATGGDAALNGVEPLKLLKAAIDIAAEMTKGRAKSLLEMLSAWADETIVSMEYAEESQRLASARGIEIDAYIDRARRGNDRAYYRGVLNIIVKPRVAFMQGLQLSLPATWQQVKQPGSTTVAFTLGSLLPLVALPPSDLVMTLAYGDGAVDAIARPGITLYHAYGAPGTYRAEVRLSSGGEIVVRQYNVVVESIAEQTNEPPSIFRAGLSVFKEGEDVSILVAVNDTDDSSLSSLRACVSTTYISDGAACGGCALTIGSSPTGWIRLAGPCAVSPRPGSTYFFKIDATDARGASAVPHRFQYTAPDTDPTADLAPVQSSVRSDQGNDGSFRVDVVADDPEARKVVTAAWLSLPGPGSYHGPSKKSGAFVASGSSTALIWPRAEVDALIKAGQAFNVLVETRDEGGNAVQQVLGPIKRVGNSGDAVVPIVMSGLEVWQSPGDLSVWGRFSLSGSPISMLRMHAGKSYSDAYCYKDLAVQQGVISFRLDAGWSSEPGRSCAALFPTEGTSMPFVIKAEVRDGNGTMYLVNGQAPNVASTLRGPDVPISVSGLGAAQSAAGQPINGSFTVAGGSVSLVRVHAGTSAATPSCYQDQSASVGAKSFSFSGSGWTNENGLNCAALIPAAGSTATLVFKIEARDGAGNLANAGTPPSVNAIWTSATPTVTGRSPSILTRNVATTVTVTGNFLPAAAVFAIDSVVCSGSYSRTATSLSQTCTAQPGTPSSVGLIVKDGPGGAVLTGGNRNYTFTVQ